MLAVVDPHRIVLNMGMLRRSGVFGLCNYPGYGFAGVVRGGVAIHIVAAFVRSSLDRFFFFLLSPCTKGRPVVAVTSKCSVCVENAGLGDSGACYCS